MNLRPNILITNDDGIMAPGIRYLTRALAQFADITVVAPQYEQSATGLSITVRRPLQIEELAWPCGTEVYSVSGKPADCVKMGLSVVLRNPPDLIVSGINRGSNAGRNIFYSGTVGAVIEGVLQGIPGIAFSCYNYAEPDYETAGKYIVPIIEHIRQHPLPVGSFLNVNFPCNPDKKYQGFKLASQGKEFWKENPNKRDHPVEKTNYYWLGACRVEHEENENSDIALLKKGFVTAVPIQIAELTHSQYLKEKSVDFEKGFICLKE